MTQVSAAAPGKLRQLAAFARAAEPRRPLSWRSAAFDVLLAATFLVVSLVVGHNYGDWVVAAVVTSAPLAVRRRYPLAAFLAVVIAALLTKSHATDVTFVAMVFAAYSAAVHSRFRGAALLSLAPVGLAVAAAFWWALPAQEMEIVGSPVPGRGVVRAVIAPGLAGIDSAARGGPLRVGGLLVLVSLVSIAVVGAAIYAGDQIRRLQAEHEAATRRAIGRERARIASELHDVVTHNVSVMIVQTGAARQVLAQSPGKATAALLAVEASGRAAMSELRHLLGLLSPVGTDGDAIPDGSAPGEELRPQPGLDQLGPLIARLATAGLPVELQVSGEEPDLPPGLDLAAFRVVQESLTNVLKHAGNSPTSVRLEYGGGDLVVDVADVGYRAAPALAVTGSAGTAPAGTAPAGAFAARAFSAGAGSAGAGSAGPVPDGGGRGLLGLRERAALYGGQLDAGPRPGGGWRVRARFPVDPPPGMADFGPAGLGPTGLSPAGLGPAAAEPG